MAQQPQPKRGVAYTVVFPLLDADGDLVTGATGLDSEVSKDLGTFVDCTNEATELAASSGMYYLTLTATEMTADIVAIIVKTSTSGAKTTPIVLYPATRDTNDLAFPTTSGRSIDVSTGGEVGLDWANVGSPTTTVGLSGTTVKTATDVETDTQDIQGRLPAALVSGRIDASVGAMAANVLTAAATAADFGTEIATAVWEAGTRTLSSFGTLVADIWAYATRLLTAGTNIVLAKGVGVTGFNDLSAAEVNAQVDAALDTAIPVSPTADSINERLKTIDDADLPGDTANIEADTQDIQTRLPAALVSGRIDASVGAMAAAVLTAAAIATDALDADALAADALDEIAARLLVFPDQRLYTYATGGVFVQANADKSEYYLNAAHIAAIVNFIWNELTSEARTAGSYGQLLKDKLVSLGAADDLLDRVAAVDGYTPRQVLKLLAAILAGKVSGYPAGPGSFRAINDAADRATITHDADGNRTASSLNL